MMQNKAPLSFLALWNADPKKDLTLERSPDASGDGVFGQIDPKRESGKFSLRFDFKDWSRDNYVFVPANVYAGNRFPAQTEGYPPRPKFLPADTPPDQLQISDVARLNYDEGESVLRRVASDAGTPGLGIWFKEQQVGLLIQTPQKFGGEEIDFVLEENADRTEASLTITATSDGTGAPFKFWTSEFACPDIASFFARFWESRKKLLQPKPRKEEIPLSACWEIQERKYNKWNWVEDFQYYKVGAERTRHVFLWSPGWVGGLINTLPLMQHGTDLSVERALKTFDFVFPEGVGASGYVYSTGDGERWISELEHEGYKNMHLVRKSADVLYFGMRQIALMEARGHEVKQVWLDSLKGIADAFVRTWERYGQFGQRVDVETGEMLIPNSTAASTAPAGLILAYRHFDDARYLEIAKAGGQRFIDIDLAMGVTSGGPGDMLQCPDSESAFGLVESLALLAEETGESRWLEAGQQAGANAASWTLSYDAELPEDSTYGKLGIQTTGTVFANAQNRHDAPGICTLSGEGLLRLYRMTGNPLFMDLLTDIAHGIPQYLSRDDRPILGKVRPEEGKDPQLPEGWICERVNVTPNWPEPIGELMRYSSWAEVALMLTWNDLPGIYWDRANDRLWVLDNVQAEIIDGSIKIHNPTKFDARVKILIESADDLKTPLPTNFGATLETIEVTAGQTLEFSQ